MRKLIFMVGLLIVFSAIGGIYNFLSDIAQERYRREQEKLDVPVWDAWEKELEEDRENN